MTSGVSVGFFDPVEFNYDPDYFCRRLKMAMPILHKGWPLQVSSITRDGKDTGVAYASIGGHIPIHIDSAGTGAPDDARMFHFVMEAVNRPCLLTSPATEANTPVVLGLEPPTLMQSWKSFGIGGSELHRGMVVHFDISTHWHGITSLPIPMESLNTHQPPQAVLIQVSGFGADQLNLALEKALAVVAGDRAFWDAGKKMISARAKH